MEALLYQTIAQELEQKILDNELKDGERLPSERTLAEQYGVSRNVLREALKILIQKKLVQNVIGKGNYVTLPKESDLATMLTSTLNTSSLPLTEIIDAREDLENCIGQHAIEHHTQEHIEELYKLYDQMETALEKPQLYFELDSQFHQMIAEFSGNSVLKIFYITLNNLIHKAFYYGDNNSTHGRMTAQEEHLMLIRAIESRDMDSYKRAIHQHLDFVREHISAV